MMVMMLQYVRQTWGEGEGGGTVDKSTYFTDKWNSGAERKKVEGGELERKREKRREGRGGGGVSR